MESDLEPETWNLELKDNGKDKQSSKKRDASSDGEALC